MAGSDLEGSMGDLAVPVDAFAVVVRAGPDGSAVVTKDHSGPLPPGGRTPAEHAAAVAREREWLLAAAGLDGIVAIVDWQDEAVLATAYAGGPTLRSHPPGPADLAAALLPVCAALDELRDRCMVHGSLAPEHVIVGPDGRGVLCSPNTGPDRLEHSDDLAGLGQTLTYCIDAWSALPHPLDRLERWMLLARRLEEGDPAMGARRVAATLDDLLDPPPAGRRARTLRLGLAVLVAGALWVTARRPADRAADGPEIQVGDTLVRVGRSGQEVVAIEGRPGCPGPLVFLLDPATSWVWVFDDIGDGAAGTPLARVPGATALEVAADRRCPGVVATGPAGQVVLHP